MLAALAATLSVLQIAHPLGDCAWRTVPDAVRSGFLAAYKTDIHQGTAFLVSQDALLEAAFARCAGGRSPTRNLIQGDIGSTALQAGAAAELRAAKGLSREELDSLWSQVPAAARDCYRDNAARAFSVVGPGCADVRATFWFFDKLHISPTTDRPTASQVVVFFNAKAQQEWAETLIVQPRPPG